MSRQNNVGRSTSRPTFADAVWFAAWIFVAHFSYLSVLQLQPALLPNGVGVAAVAGNQIQTLVASVFVAALFLAIYRVGWLRLAFVAALTLLFSLYATNNVYLNVSGQPFSLSATEGISVGDIDRYWGSFIAELRVLQYLGYGLVLAIGGLLFWGASSLEVARSRRLNRAPFYVGASLLFLTVAGYGLADKADDRIEALTRNPVLALVTELGAEDSEVPPSLREMIQPEKLYRLEHGAEVVDSGKRSALGKNLELLRKRERNAVFVILESVGSEQILENGIPRADIAPFLHSEAKNAIIFDNLYTVFPGSTRSHIAISTGGRTITWGSVYAELLYPFRGQTLVSAFEERGRPTGLFSAGGLDFENLNIFYANLGFDQTFNPDSFPADEVAKHSTHSWGVDERLVAEHALKWASGREPFFLMFLNVITHHPYGAPADYKSPFTGSDNFDRYRSAVHFTDSVLRTMVEGLKSQGLSKDTLLFIVGDHGEAFGDRHANNFLHNNYLYEENIRDFLMIIDLAGEIEPLRMPVRGSVADIMPTVLDTQGIRAEREVIGQSLFSPDYQERMAFFHKNSAPEKWGLRDGQWKFIADKADSGNPELYDLDSDPDEQSNLAAKYPERIGDYVDRLANWYVQTNEAFVSKLEGYDHQSGGHVTVANMASPGPKRIAIGSKRDHLPFVPFEGDINPEEDFVVWTNGPAFPQTKNIEYRFTGPSGDKQSIYMDHDSEWSTAWMRPSLTAPREEGVWRVELYDGDHKILEKLFTVSRNAPLRWSFLDKKPGIRDINVGVKPEGEDFLVLQNIHPRESAAVIVHGVPFEQDRLLEYLWIAPDDTYSAYTFTQEAGWDTSWTFRQPDEPMAPGKWRVEVWMDGEFLTARDFDVTEAAPLFLPAGGMESN